MSCGRKLEKAGRIARAIYYITGLILLLGPYAQKWIVSLTGGWGMLVDAIWPIASVLAGFLILRELFSMRRQLYRGARELNEARANTSKAMANTEALKDRYGQLECDVTLLARRTKMTHEGPVLKWEEPEQPLEFKEATAWHGLFEFLDTVVNAPGSW